MLTCFFLAVAAHAIRAYGRTHGPVRGRSQRKRGFSLIELTVVLMIMAIGATIALPRLAETVSRQRLESVAKSIQCDLELARRTAMNRGRTVTVQFEFDNARYHSADVMISAGRSETLQTDLSTKFGEDVELSADFFGAAGIQFDQRGTPTMTDLQGANQSIGTITVLCEGGRLNLQIHPGLSLVSLEQDD
ncbi:prepilin-type N-terminal cleavage/methylation domain-containing protein [Neorhodopirellula pilleata]|uniref:Type II secretion system protein H n=1 Tax=Neorhodopirellula pilleata TaxID=2714738 RepID=A0A5C6AU24_9BACT|nr:prepilin-type N-terminal cleavage/methylation domain-containing protein [Neorhodopirellula pilleata]TWU03240.1 hypothetical protein Pla100_01580 [Neorhodopirellula pilleata]